jgi:hypothetical protein
LKVEALALGRSLRDNPEWGENEELGRISLLHLVVKSLVLERAAPCLSMSAYFDSKVKKELFLMRKGLLL